MANRYLWLFIFFLPEWFALREHLIFSYTELKSDKFFLI
jgi:hypothetical protein